MDSPAYILSHTHTHTHMFGTALSLCPSRPSSLNTYPSPLFRNSFPTFTCSAATSSDFEAQEFFNASKTANLISISRCIDSDGLDPVLAHQCLTQENDWTTPSFLIESGRYSIVGVKPTIEIEAKGQHIIIRDHEKDRLTKKMAVHPFCVPVDILQQWKLESISQIPDTFCGGWVGYYSYDTLRHITKIWKLEDWQLHDDRNLPDLHVGLYDEVVVFDTLEKKIHIVHWVRLEEDSCVADAYSNAIRRLSMLLQKFQIVGCTKLSVDLVKSNVKLIGSSLKATNMDGSLFKEVVRMVKGKISDGDISHLLLSQRFEYQSSANPFQVYQGLKSLIPSFHNAYYQSKSCILATSCPGVLTRVKEEAVEQMMVMSSRKYPDGLDILKTPHKIFNHMMDMDIKRYEKLDRLVKTRKKLDKAVLYGIKVKNIEYETYQNIKHISATIRGTLRDHLTGTCDALQVALDPRTLNGTPKERAMDLIDDIEKVRRGPYSGGLGTISFHGDIDMAVAPNTILFPTRLQQGGKWVAHLQVGTVIVKESCPDYEDEECQDQGLALAETIASAEESFVKGG